MLKYNFASRLFFAGLGFCIVLALPVVAGDQVAAKYYTIIMALNLFSGWFSLSFRQQFYLDIQSCHRGGASRPTLAANIATTGTTLALMVACVVIAPFVVKDLNGLRIAFFIGILAAYLISVSYVSFWYDGKLYLSYAIDASITIIVFLTIFISGEPNFVVGLSAVLLIAAAVFARVGLGHWLNTPRSPNTLASQLLGQLISVASFAEVVFFAGVEIASDIVTYRIALSLMSIFAILFGVVRQWEIVKNTVVPKRWRTTSVFAASIGIMLASYGAFMVFPPALFVLLLLAAMAQLVATLDQFLVMRDNRSLALVIGYAIALSLSFGGAYLLGVSDLYSLLLFKIVLIGMTTLVPASVVLIFGLRDAGE